MAIDFVIGGPARDEDFCFRESFLEDLKDSLKKSDVLIVAPRRMGKTSVMYKIIDDPPEDTLVIHMNVEALNTPGDFILNLINALYEYHPGFVKNHLEEMWNWLGSIFSRINKIEVVNFKIELRKEKDLQEKWQEKAEELIQLLSRSNQKLLFIVDEIPDMINRILKKDKENLETFLHWFRTVRTDPNNTNIRWLLGGSVNLRSSLSQIGLLNLINDLNIEILPPFTDIEVEKFIKVILNSKSVNFDPGIISRIKELLGNPIPFFLQLMCQELYRYWRRSGKKTISVENVEHVYETSIMGEQARDKLQHFKDRIYRYYKKHEQDAVFEILEKLSNSEHGISGENILTLYKSIKEKTSINDEKQNRNREFTELVQQLKNDFYIEQNKEGQLYFSNRLLKEWWRRN